ncbi:hypothetical protein T10_559 [Trichinella papuae]|uniref:Uncharacterized protein n=1 Tax=Trichinella papuae TaxID=268474 RepID=A0A0V1N7H0_9BILA|nr:hypothetical protein T10_559 [Trichinella papuae]
MHRRPRTLLDDLHPDRAKPVYIKNYSKEIKWIPAIIERQTGPVSDDTGTPEGERHRRHEDQLRTRFDTRKEGTEGRFPEERRTEESEVADWNTERITYTDGSDGHRPTKLRHKTATDNVCIRMFNIPLLFSIINAVYGLVQLFPGFGILKTLYGSFVCGGWFGECGRCFLIVHCWNWSITLKASFLQIQLRFKCSSIL